MITAYADPWGLVSLIKHEGPTERDVDAGTVVRGLILETRSGRSPRSRVEACWAQPDPAWRLGQALPPQAWNAEPGGRGLDRL
jgi:hypothetical protein